MGVASSLLHCQRRCAAAVAAPANGLAGQELDVALILADGGPKGKADPAFPAHIATICPWAMAVFEQWMPMSHWARAIATAKLVLVKSVVPWLKVRGAAAAFVASGARLGWVVRDAATCITDLEQLLSLTLDPPAVIRVDVEESVRRWHWRNVAVNHSFFPAFWW